MALSIVVLVVVAGGVVSGFVGLALAGYAWQNREVPSALPYGLVALATTGWAFFDSALLLSRSPDTALLLYRLSASVSVQLPALWLLFTLVYTGGRTWLRPKRIAVLWTYPVGYVLLVLTTSVHDLLPESARIVTTNRITGPVIPWTAGAWVAQGFAYLYILAGYAVLVRFIVRSRNVYRKQASAILAGSLFPLAANVLSIFGFVPHPAIDLTPIAFTFNGVVVAWALFRYDFLNVTPLAGDVLVDEMPDPVFVLDENDAVIDYNPAGEQVTGEVNPTGRHVEDVFPDVIGRAESGSTISIAGSRDGSEADDPVVYDPRLTAIHDQYDIERGRLLVLRNVSVQQRRLNRLEALQAATQQFIQATSEADVAEAAVDFAERVLDQELAVLYEYDVDDDRLAIAAMTDDAEAELDASEAPVADGGLVWDAFETGDVEVYEHDAGDDRLEPFLRELSPSRMLVLPLGRQGVFCVGTSYSGDYTSEDEQFAKILARTTETALARVARERELRESRSAVRRRTEQIEFFNGVLRHNIRNGMLVIDGNVDYLREFVDDEYHDKLGTISEWCDELTELTEKIRRFNETVTATEEERLAPTDLSSIVRERATEIDEEYDDLDVDVSVEDGIVVEANDLVEEVIESILRNAVEHNDSDRPSIDVTSRRAADWIQLRIADNGPGISDELKETIFERNVATSQTAHGFGLYFVSVMMDLYGGNVWFEDNDPEGAVAVLEFQLLPEAPLLES